MMMMMVSVDGGDDGIGDDDRDGVGDNGDDGAGRNDGRNSPSDHRGQTRHSSRHRISV